MTDLASKLLDRLRRPVHIYRSLRLDLDAVNTLCVTLGPNRNLTTLTASLVALHPQCQVLNHAWGRQREQAEALFEEPGGHRYERFVRMAVARSQGGRRGRYGGSVTHSHAFKRPAMREAYERRYGKAVIKEDIRCVYWKSAKQVTRYVREHGIDLAEVAEREPRLRFMMPLRNPLDCALSNYRKGHHRHFPQLAGGPVEPVIDFMTELVGWFLDLRREHPSAFFGFLESEWGRPMLERLASFLRVDTDEIWMRDVLRSQPRGTAYDYDPAHLKVYAESLRTHLHGHPEIQREFAERAGVSV
jgi:hypothetical protein